VTAGGVFSKKKKAAFGEFVTVEKKHPTQESYGAVLGIR